LLVLQKLEAGEFQIGHNFSNMEASFLTQILPHFDSVGWFGKRFEKTSPGGGVF
jgi:hypothetical protein